MLQQQVKELQEQLAAKNQLIKEKDKQMFELAKAPRTVNNITVESSVNTFGNGHVILCKHQIM